MRLLKQINEARGTSILEIAQVLQSKCQPYLKQMGKTAYTCDLHSGRNDSRDYFVKPIRKNRTAKDTPQDLSDEFDGLFYSKFRWRPRSEGLFVTGHKYSAEDYGTVYSIFPVGKFKFVWSPSISDLWGEVDDGSGIAEFYSYGEAPDPDPYERDDYYNSILYDMEQEYESENPEPQEEDFEDEDGEVDDAAHSDALYDWEAEREEWARNRAEDLTAEWEEEWRRNYENTVLDRLSDMVSDYTDKDLVRAIKSKKEIMIGGKEYVAVNHKRYYKYLSAFITWYSKKRSWSKAPTKNDMREFLSDWSKIFSPDEINWYVL